MFFQATNEGHIRKLADALLSCSIGARVTYDQLSRAINEPIIRRRYLVHKAMHLANLEAGATFRNVRLVGYERMPAESVHTLGKSARHRVRRISRRTVTQMTNAVIKANDMSNDARMKVYAEQATLGLIQHMTYDRNMPVVKEGSAPPPTAETIRNTMDALRAHRAAGG